MKSRNSNAIICLCFITLMFSCKKEKEEVLPSNPVTTATFIPLVTAIGTPVGSSNSANIGTAGGSILSDDGRLEIIFPPNALNATTEISIQPVTNECTGGIGLAYDLSPHGAQFNTPVTIQFHYSASDLVGSMPMVLEVASQHDDNIWYAFASKNLDEVNSTLSISTSHFSAYSYYEEYILLPTEATIQVNEIKNMKVWYVERSADESMDEPPLGNLVAYDQYLPEVHWYVNGEIGVGLDNGWMTPTLGNTISTYTAPAHIDNMVSNPADVAVTFPIDEGTLTMNSAITVVEFGEQYTLHFESDYSGAYTTFSCYLGGETAYIDGFDVHITAGENGVVTTNSITNLTPAPLFISVGCTCENMVFSGQGSLIDFYNFTATHDSSGQLFYDYGYSWNGPDETINCGDGPVTYDGMDWTDVDGGNFFLPVDSAVYAWQLGTVKVVHIQ